MLAQNLFGDAGIALAVDIDRLERANDHLHDILVVFDECAFATVAYQIARPQPQRNRNSIAAAGRGVARTSTQRWG